MSDFVQQSGSQLNTSQYLPILLAISMAAAMVCCGRASSPGVREIPSPEYPISAQAAHFEGTVEMTVQVDVNGKVLSTMIDGEKTAANQDLVNAARQNAKGWTWGPFPAEFQFPWYHRLRYVYKLRGTSTPFAVRPPVVRTHLPDEIEIIAVPCVNGPLELQEQKSGK